MKKWNSKVVLSSLVCVAVASALSISVAHAKGGGSTGGADAVTDCEGYNAMEDTLADLVTGPSLRKISGIPVAAIADELTDAYRRNLYARNDDMKKAISLLQMKIIADERPAEAQQVQKALNSLSFIEVKSVPTVDTGLDQSLTGSCRRVQLAVQDFSSRKVFYRSHFSEMPNNDDNYLDSIDSMGLVAQQSFILHEGYLRWAYDQGNDLKTSETIARAKVGEVVNSSKFIKGVVRLIFPSHSQIPFESDELRTPGYYALYSYIWAPIFTFNDLDGNYVDSENHDLYLYPQTLQKFSEIVSKLKLPCAMNPDAVSDISSGKYKNMVDTSPWADTEEDQRNNPFVRLCAPR